jgi:hypothetical protein
MGNNFDPSLFYNVREDISVTFSFVVTCTFILEAQNRATDFLTYEFVGIE